MPAQFRDLFTEAAARQLATMLLRVAFIIGGAVVTNFLLRRGIRQVWLAFVHRLQGERTDAELEKQATTIAGVLQRTTTVLIYALAVFMALRELGFDIAPLLAGAGVAGLAIGFGAQNLVRDVISGFFLLIENQIRVNDAVIINDTPGMVEEINLRTTVLRDGEGTVHVFPNGAITKLANRTQGFSYYVFSLHLSYKDDPDQAVALLKETAAEVAATDPFKQYVLSELEIWGLDSLGETHMVVKGRIKTLPGKQWDVGREINRRLKPRLDAAGFELPARGLRRVEMAVPASEFATPAMTPALLRAAVREVLEEMQGRDDSDARPAPRS